MNAQDQTEQIKKAAAWIGQYQTTPAQIALVLGSGLGDFARQIAVEHEIPYAQIPGFPVSTVPGHSGKLILGSFRGIPLIALSGRFHYYEGYTMETIAFPVRVLHCLGVKRLILTNAAGGVNTAYNPGDLMAITDHIKFFDESPLRGPNLDEFGPRFCDMSDVYDRAGRHLLLEAAQECGVLLHEGVYFFMPGPSFETPAEIRAIRLLGADAVGMSTVPEAIAAVHCGMKVTGVSCVTNMAAGILDQPLSHEEVMATGDAVADKFARLIAAFLGKLNG